MRFFNAYNSFYGGYFIAFSLSMVFTVNRDIFLMWFVSLMFFVAKMNRWLR